MRVGMVRLRVHSVFCVGRESERGKDHADERECQAGAAKRVDAFAACDRERDGEGRVGRGDRAGDADGSNFERAIETEPRKGIDHAGDGGEEPGCPARWKAPREASGEPEESAEGGKAKELNDHERAEGADAPRGKARGKIRHTPAECRRYSEDDVQESSIVGV